MSNGGAGEAETAGGALAREVADAVFATFGLLRREMRRALGPAVSMSQFHLLRHLGRSPGVSLGELARRLGLSAPTVSRLVDGLVERAWVERRQCEDNRRRIALALTPAGEEQLATGRAAALAALSRRLEALDAPAAAELATGLAVLRGALAGAEEAS